MKYYFSGRKPLKILHYKTNRGSNIVNELTLINEIQISQYQYYL